MPKGAASAPLRVFILSQRTACPACHLGSAHTRGGPAVMTMQHTGDLPGGQGRTGVAPRPSQSPVIQNSHHTSSPASSHAARKGDRVAPQPPHSRTMFSPMSACSWTYSRHHPQQISVHHTCMQCSTRTCTQARMHAHARTRRYYVPCSYHQV